MYLYFILSGLFNALASTFLGVLVLVKNKKSRINRLFAFLCFGFAAWSYPYTMWPLVHTKEATLFWFQMLHFGAIFIPIAYFHFVLSWIGDDFKKKSQIMIGYLFAIIFCCFVFSPLFIADMRPLFSMRWWAKPGIVYYFYLTYFFFYYIYASILLFLGYLRSDGIKRSQTKFILVGIVIAIAGGSTNYFLWFDINIPPYGNILACTHVILGAYAIIKYRLMDIKFVLGRVAIYAISIGMVIGISWVANTFIFNFSGPSFVVTGPIALIFGIVLFQIIFRWLEKFASKYFFYSFYSSQRVLRELSNKITQVLQIDELSDLIIDTLLETMKVDRAVILLRNEKTGEYKIQKNIGFDEKSEMSMLKDNFLTSWLEKHQQPIIHGEISLLIRDTNDKLEKEKLEVLKNNMEKMEAVLCLPLFFEKRISGMIILGNKMSKDPYSDQDVNLLTNLSNHASVAIQNAKLYSEVKNFNKKLEMEVRERTKELTMAYDDLKKLDVAKSQFLSIASHQLRTPLSAIKGYVSMMLENSYGTPPKEMETPLKNIYASNERLLTLINGLLDVSRIEAGKIQLNKQELDIREIIDSIVNELSNIALNKNLLLKYKKGRKSLPKMMIDGEKIRQVLLNLIDNSIKYTQKGKIEISAEQEGNNILVKIKDTGVGLTKEEEEKLFKSFSRVGEGPKLNTEGVGIGLYIAKMFVGLHNGECWVESEGKDKGSTFFVQLPIK